GPHPHRHDADLPCRKHDGRAVAERVIVQIGAGGGERVRHVPHLVPFAEPDGGAEIVLHDAEMVPVVVNVGGELGAVAPAHAPLRTAAGSVHRTARRKARCHIAAETRGGSWGRPAPGSPSWRAGVTTTPPARN